MFSKHLNKLASKGTICEAETSNNHEFISNNESNRIDPKQDFRVRISIA